MDITKSQSDFEAWFKSEFIVPASSLTLSPETFKNAVQKAYQAGRESIEMELPKPEFYMAGGSQYMEKGDVIKVCRTAGIRIKCNERCNSDP
ncbi:hypothetical protein, partial [Yersinia pseudotuberculosis]|uniref:hypothetical protein n=1 Tax=Yersinia pseudotuberculosis TaxID=633 RepID=UPI001E309BC9